MHLIELVMRRLKQRTIERAHFDGPLGIVSAKELLEIPESVWRHWKDMLTGGRHSTTAGYVARCALCQGRVYIYLCKGFPAFAHFKGEGEACAWHTGTALTPDDVRKIQYAGEQESKLHRDLCDAVHDHLSADSRYSNLTCNQRLNAVGGERWRIPDVSATRDGSVRLAIELQLSNTFQTEISVRTIVYNGQDIGLLWVFHGRRPDL